MNEKLIKLFCTFPIVSIISNGVIFQSFEPQPVDQKDFGKFYEGDSYVVLHVSTSNKI